MRFHFLRLLLPLLLVLGLGVTTHGAEKRVLFIVETSRDTKALAEAEQKLVAALIETGLGGLLEANDTLGFWTFDETLHVGKLPMQRWTPESKNQIVDRTRDFLKMQSYSKAPRIETVWRPLQSVIQDSPALMIVLVTSGKQPVSTTPFDAEINRHLKSAYREYQKKKTPVAIVFSATSGQILRFSVNPAIGDVRIPVLTMPTNAAPVKIAQPTPPPSVVTMVPPPRPAPKASPDAPALVITKDGTRNVSRKEADQLSPQGNSSRPSAPSPVSLPQLPDGTEIKGPMILSHAVEEVKHAIPIKLPNGTNNESASLHVAVLEPSPKPAPPRAEPGPMPAPVVSPFPAAPAQAQQAPSKPTVVVESVPLPPKESKPTPKVPSPIEATNKTQPSVTASAQTTTNATAALMVAPKMEPPIVVKKTDETGQSTLVAPPKVATTTAEPMTPSPARIPSLKDEGAPDANAPVQPLIAETVPQNRNSTFILFAAIGLIVVAIFLAFLVGRKMGTRPQQSLVSDWAERDRLKK